MVKLKHKMIVITFIAGVHVYRMNFDPKEQSQSVISDSKGRVRGVCSTVALSRGKESW